MDDAQIGIDEDNGHRERIKCLLERRGNHALDIANLADRPRAPKMRDQSPRRPDLNVFSVSRRSEAEKCERSDHGRVTRETNCQNVVCAELPAPFPIKPMVLPLRSVSQPR